MKGKNLDIEHWQKQFRAFADARDWGQFHTAKNIAMALSVECSELMEHFQWLNDEQVKNIKQAPAEFKQKVSEEVADVMLYLLRFCDLMDVDAEQAMTDKMIKNADKYPVEKSKGNAKKYTEL